MGKVYVLTVDGAVSLVLKTEGAVAFDYLKFIGNVIETLQKDGEALEMEANKSGRTTVTGFNGVGSLPLESVDVKKITDK